VLVAEVAALRAQPLAEWAIALAAEGRLDERYSDYVSRHCLHLDISDASNAAAEFDAIVAHAVEGAASEARQAGLDEAVARAGVRHAFALAVRQLRAADRPDFGGDSHGSAATAQLRLVRAYQRSQSLYVVTHPMSYPLVVGLGASPSIHP